MIKEKIIECKELNKKYNLVFIFSLLTSIAFLIYNAYIGIFNGLIWNISISIYYALLVIIRMISLIENRNSKKKNREYNKKIYIILSILSSCITLVLTGPVILMLEQKKTVNFGTITAIALAAYTTFKMYRAISNLINLKKENNLFTRQNFTISIMAAFVSVLTLQNTLIYVFDTSEDKSDLLILCIVSSISILLFIFVFSIYSFISGLKKSNK